MLFWSEALLLYCLSIYWVLSLLLLIGWFAVIFRSFMLICSLSSSIPQVYVFFLGLHSLLIFLAFICWYCIIVCLLLLNFSWNCVIYLSYLASCTCHISHTCRILHHILVIFYLLLASVLTLFFTLVFHIIKVTYLSL